MGVFIRGMEKPKDCYNCNFNESDICCSITKGKIDRDDYTCEINCPLIEIKTPHGRLVYESEIHTGIRMEENTEYRYFIDRVDAPTVIEAEGE